MYQLTVSGEFDSAHFLPGYQGKCANLHGHRWRVEAVFAAETLQTEGEKRDMLIDFGDLKRVVRDLCDFFDHKCIVREGSLLPITKEAFEKQGFCWIELPFSPTAERLAEYFYARFAQCELPVAAVRVYETPENVAEYKPEKGV
jgi:6-pyruvoyltetrahydropterin/6-carboxytetrahydropterin synthase